MRDFGQRLLAVTPGDPDGIGPEIAWKAIERGEYDRAGVKLLCVGARKPFDALGARIVEVDDPSQVVPASAPTVFLLAAPERAPRSRFLPGYQAGWAIETATKLVLSGRADALVTGPISKERLQKGGFRYPGHTEFLAKLCGDKEVTPRRGREVTPRRSREVTMMLANEILRVTLVTTHVALKNVSRALTRAEIRRAVLHTATHLRDWWKIPLPRVGVAALNPHAGEGGLFGSEDQRIVAPEIRALAKKFAGQFVIEGPFPADTLFAKNATAEPSKRYDAIVCMYHDQGLIPVKLVDFQRTVNVTLGLPIVRTSVDHGTSFDIAGKGIADPSSFQSAVELAIQIVKNRGHV